MRTTEDILNKFLNKKVKYLVRSNEGTPGSIERQEHEGTLVGYDDRGIILMIDSKIKDLPERYQLISWDTEFNISA